MTEQNEYKSGYVAIVGRPNVGKSSLLNSILQQKISITTPKPQTTRWQINGIKTTEHEQVVYIDTPGMHQDVKKSMNRYMNRIAQSVLSDADVIVFVVDATSWRNDDELVLEKLKHCKQPVILVVNKVDLLKDKREVLPYIQKLEQKMSFKEIIPLSALDHDNVEELEKILSRLIPAGPKLYPDEMVTDRQQRFQIGETIREKLIMATEEELPYATTIEIEQLKDTEKMYEISAIIWVERQGQKAIVIGKKGQRLKLIGTKARIDLERMLKKKVFLRLWVKVKERWTDDANALKGLGYE